MDIVLIAHDVRSTHNIGSLARSADGFGVLTIFCTGYTPYIKANPDERPPHIRQKISIDIHKTALGAEESVNIIHHSSLKDLIQELRTTGYAIAALEQSASSVPLKKFDKKAKLALILGTETTGIPEEILKLCDLTLEIPMLGQKESLNVSIAGAVAMYELKRSELY